LHNKFWVLRTFGMLFKTLAWLILALGSVGAILGVAFGVAPDVITGGTVPPGAILPGFPGGLLFIGVLSAMVSFFMAVVAFVFIHAFGDLIDLVIALEENTRLVAERLKEQAGEPPAQEPPAKELRPKQEPVPPSTMEKPAEENTP
jgi:hypothetical protein